jgi:hypothetical protein
MSDHLDSQQQTHLGSFPIVGPVTYLTDDPIECQRLMEGPLPAIRKWFHGTSERVARLACIQGIVPGGWIQAGGQCCGILGYDSLNEFLDRRNHLWIIEIFGPALDGDVKAWWVPPSSIQGVWHGETFIPRELMAAQHDEVAAEFRCGCNCNLKEICVQQRAVWQATWATV